MGVLLLRWQRKLMLLWSTRCGFLVNRGSLAFRCIDVYVNWLYLFVTQVVQKALDDAKLPASDLSAVAVTIGPGLSLCLRGMFWLLFIYWTVEMSVHEIPFPACKVCTWAYQFDISMWCFECVELDETRNSLFNDKRYAFVLLFMRTLLLTLLDFHDFIWHAMC